MSRHPNTLLICTLTPHALARKTMSDILAANGVDDPEMDDLRIGTDSYHAKVMEESYDEGFQIAAKEGDLIFWDCVTYGYGEQIEWSTLEAQKNELEAWAKKTCNEFKCDYKISVAANYW